MTDPLASQRVMLMKLSNITSSFKGWATSWIYRYYEKDLYNQVKKGLIPNHVGMILDGNRRWAREMGMAANSGHKYGFNKIKQVLGWCWDLGIETVTVYALSTENLNRSEEEVKEIFNLVEKGFEEVLEDHEIHSKKVKVKALGRMDLLNDSLRDTINKAAEKTKDYSRFKLNIAIAYGGRAEIIDATKKIVISVTQGKLMVENINEATFSRFLYTAGDPDPDLIIRTSGEERLSGFLLWQSAYSEFYFMDVYWPGLRRIDFLRAIRTYQKRQRRFGV